MTHSLERTSPKGEAFRGRCTLCGKENLRASDANKLCENPNNVSQNQVLLNAIKGPMTLEELNTAMMRDIQLHESVELIYVVDGWLATYSPDDGNTQIKFRAPTPIEALIACFSEIRNRRGRE